MDNFKFNCPYCKQSLEAPFDMDGLLIDCPSCNKKIRASTSQSKPMGVTRPPPLSQGKGATANNSKFASGFRRIYALYSVVIILVFISPWPSDVAPSSRAWQRWGNSEFDRWYADDIYAFSVEAHKRDEQSLADLTHHVPDGIIPENPTSYALTAKVLMQGGQIGFDYENKKWVYTDSALRGRAYFTREKCASEGGRLIRGFVLFWLVKFSGLLIIMLIVPIILFRAGKWVYDGFQK